MAECQETQTVIFDPSLIPPCAADYLACRTLELVRWMKTIPKYRDAMDALTAARKAAREREEGCA